MRLVFHGPLKEQFGDHVDMTADSVADALEGFSRQVAWPDDMPVHVLTTTQAINTPELLAEKPEIVHIIPAIRGGSGKWFNIIVGAALVVAGVLTGNVQLIVMGAMMFLQGVLAFFMKAPKVTTDPDASKYITVNKNTTEVGTPITMAWGCIDLGGQWLSLQSDSSNLSFGVFPTSLT